MTCFMVLGWKFPVHIFDLHTAYLAASNILLPHDPDEVRKKPRKRLSDACRAYGIAGWEQIDKEAIARDIGEGRWRDYGQEAVFDYCEEDVREFGAVAARAIVRPCRFARQSTSSACCIGQITAPRRWRRSRHAACRSTWRLWNLVQENKAAVIGKLLRQFDPSYGSDDPIYTPEGEWSYERFEHWLVNTGVPAWPRLDSGRLDIDGDAFRLMYHVPGIERLHALRDSLGVIVRRETADRPRRPKPAEPIPVLHRHRTKCARQKPLQRARRHALLHGVSAGHDRRLSRLADAGSRNCRGAVRRSKH